MGRNIGVVERHRRASALNTKAPLGTRLTALARLGQMEFLPSGRFLCELLSQRGLHPKLQVAASDLLERVQRNDRRRRAKAAKDAEARAQSVLVPVETPKAENVESIFGMPDKPTTPEKSPELLQAEAEAELFLAQCEAEDPEFKAWCEAERAKEIAANPKLSQFKRLFGTKATLS